MLEKIVEQIVAVRAANMLPSRVMISLHDLKRLMREPMVKKNGLKNQIEEQGMMWGLEITLVGKGCPYHVLPRDGKTLSPTKKK